MPMIDAWWNTNNTNNDSNNNSSSSPLSYQDWVSSNYGNSNQFLMEDYQNYLNTFSNTTTQQDTGTVSTSNTPIDLTQYNTSGQTAQVVPNKADVNVPNQINVADYGGQVATNPSLGMTTDNPDTPQNESTFLQDQLSGSQMTGNESGTTIDPTQQQYQNSDISATAATGTAAQGQTPQPTDVNTYNAQQVSGQVQDGTAAQGQLSDGAIISDQSVQLDTETIGNGQTATGQALQEAAYQDITTVLNTSNPLEAALAKQLGEFNYIDSKATVQGQLEQLQSQFVDANGNPKIPSWAAGTARNVAKIATFSGMTGTAATAMMAQALMEASIPVATADAQFFQTVTLQNLSNEQEATINRANVLAKMDMMNLDNRMAAAVQNSKNFLAMDLQNLDNQQQTNVLNTQQRFQALLEDGRQVNAQRLFEAENQNDLDKFYAELGSQMEQFNVGQQNAMGMFNTDQVNSIATLNANLANARDQFYASMQYNIDLANARWRQEVTMTEDAQAFEAASTDVQNMLNISQEQLNQLWDRSDSLLDYVWKSSENAADRATSIAIAELQAQTTRYTSQLNLDAADAQGSGALWGSILGSVAGGISKSIDWGSLFGF